MVRRALIALALASTVATTACGDDGDTTTATTTAAADGAGFNGLVREPPLDVGDESLPEVTSGAPGEDFAFIADEGGLLLVYFGYTACPDVCPTTLADISSALEGLGPEADRVALAMATVDPERDTPEVLSGYVTFFVDGAHALRTEDRDRLDEVQGAFTASSAIIPVEGSDTYEVEHTASVYVVDEDGRVVLEWPYGLKGPAMQEDLETLLTDIPPTTTNEQETT